MTGRTYRNLAAAVAVIALIIGGAAGVSAQKKGGTIRVGNLGEPPTLDAHWTTASITETLTNHIYEGLLTLDDENKPIPMLAESHADGLAGRPHLHVQAPARHQVPQRQGDDVGRRGRLAHAVEQAVHLRQGPVQLRRGGRPPGGRQVHRRAEAEGEGRRSSRSTWRWPTTSPRSTRRRSPRSSRPAEKVTEYVGTGPFKLVEWKPDQYIRMVRFDDYKPRSEKPNGYGGAQDRVRRRDPLDPGAGRRDPRRPDGDRASSSWPTT